MLKDGVDVLSKDSVHEAGVQWQQTLKESDEAPAGGGGYTHVVTLLGSSQRQGCGANIFIHRTNI